MAIERLCKICGTRMLAYTTLQNKCRECVLTNAKPIPQRGRKARQYEVFRDKVAIPYLEKKYGRKCDHCKRENIPLDVAHKKTRGSRPDLKFDVHNLRFLCRPCHRLETDGKLSK